MAFDPATITLAATTVAGIIWAYLERRAKNITKEEKGALEDKVLNVMENGITAEEAYDVFKDVVKYSRN
jgi:hypothetical protein